MLERLLTRIDPHAARILDRALAGSELGVSEAVRLLAARGMDFHALLQAADLARLEDKGDDVSYVVCRNVNFTNICYRGCSFCGFSRRKHEAGAADWSLPEILAKCRDGVARGATEVCIQGGIHPNKNHTHYRAILEAVKGEFPDLHIHAYSPEEIDFGHRKSGMKLGQYLKWLMDAGLGSMPGTAAEILDDELRALIAPRKIKTARWVEIIETAHSIGLRTTATLLYGHVETHQQVANHLELLRAVQKRTGGFTELVPLGFIHERNALYNYMGARPGSAMQEDLRLVAVSRLFLRPWVPNIQVSWTKLGHKMAQMGLLSGANDFGGTLMEESISRGSGSRHGENTPPEEFRRLIREIGRIPVERSTLYEVLRRFDDPALDPPSREPRPESEADAVAGATR